MVPDDIAKKGKEKRWRIVTMVLIFPHDSFILTLSVVVSLLCPLLHILRY